MGLFSKIKKIFKKVVKVAAFVGIAVFAAPVAAAIGLSAAIGTVAGAALVGAAAGAATNGLLGGGVLKGALMGGLGGAIGGISQVAKTGTSILGDAYAGSGGPLVGGGSPLFGGGAAAGGEGAASAAAAAGGLPADIIVNASQPWLPGVVTSAAPTLAGVGAGLAAGAGGGGGSAAAGSEGITDAPITVTGTPVTGIAAAAPELAAAAGAGVGIANAGLDVGGQGPPNEQAVSDAGRAPLDVAPTGGWGEVSTAGGGGLLGSLGGTLGDVAKAVAPPLLASALVPQVPGGGATGDGLTGQDIVSRQDQIIEDQKKAIEDAQKKYNDNFNLKTGYAQGLIDDANQYDPEVAGRRAAEAARIRAGLSARNSARGQGGRRAEIIQRQGEIEGGRDATAAYWNAYGTTGAQRTGLRSAGINAIPLGNQPGASDYDSMYDSITGQGTAEDAERRRLEEERRKQVQQIGGLITSGLGAAFGNNTGDRA